MKQKNINADAAEFWKGFEETHGEQVQAFCLGLYLRGCAAIENSIWGLLIATDSGFRFHHFAQEGWISALSRLTAGGSGKGPKEVSIFIPKEKIISVEYRVETNWLKKTFTASQPLFVLCYYDEANAKRELIAEADKGCLDIVEELKETLGSNEQ
jgi:hypothetical protein